MLMDQLFSLSDESKYITGSLLTVDGVIHQNGIMCKLEQDQQGFQIKY